MNTFIFSEVVLRQFCCDDVFIGVYWTGNFLGDSYIQHRSHQTNIVADFSDFVADVAYSILFLKSFNLNLFYHSFN